MTNIFFVSETYIKENSPVSQNVDIKDIRPFVPMAQDLFLQPILGTNFYRYLSNVFASGTTNANEDELISYIEPAVAYKACELAMPFLNQQIKNKGNQFQSGDFSSPGTTDDTRYLKNELKNVSEFFFERLRKYLCENEDLFPQYKQDNDSDMKPDTSTNYSWGIILPKNKNYTTWGPKTGGCC